MIWAIAIIFILLWALGLATSITISGFIHLFLVAAVAMVIIRVIQIRRASKLKTIS
ncbi:MAG: lmo0937 family membrane protein [Deltaproteobacteria bacterium]|nr:lmo0937 family membrane protein [Deltaproteobacteria bacterium]